MTVQKQIDQLITQRASEWVEILKTADAAQRKEFVDWLQESRRHIAEFLTIAALDQELLAIEPLAPDELNRLMQRSRPDIAQLPVAEAAARSKRTVLARLPRPSNWRLSIAAGMAALTLLILIGVRPLTQGRNVLATTGQNQSVELTDGSVVQLNADSQVDVTFALGRRDLRLTGGEALFKVAHDPRRPFRVYTRNAIVQALGTQFNINARGADTTISVIEGTVVVFEGTTGFEGGPLKRLSTLGAGEEVTLSAQGKLEHRPAANVADAIAWRQRRLVFKSATLGEVAGEFNRYNVVPKLHLEGVDERAYHFSATFDADDPSSFADVLAHEPDLTVQWNADEILVRKRTKPASP